jgi:hypothetical protein
VKRWTPSDRNRTLAAHHRISFDDLGLIEAAEINAEIRSMWRQCATVSEIYVRAGAGAPRVPRPCDFGLLERRSCQSALECWPAHRCADCARLVDVDSPPLRQFGELVAPESTGGGI